MKVCGVICEYNPFHNGHKKQLSLIRQALGEDTVIVCLMSGNFVQRGAPAIFDKSLRAASALENGADLILELPVTCCLSSAEGFAAGGVSILSKICTHLSFGCETPDASRLLSTAKALLQEDFSQVLRSQLSTGVSFPKARQLALAETAGDAALLTDPNNILAVEYCKAILSQNSSLQILPISREGSYHSEIPDGDNPSATSLRIALSKGADISAYAPSSHLGTIHDLHAGQRAILGKLRTMTDAEFEALPYGSEGLWRKLMTNARAFATLEEILEATKSKRYTRTRLDRMVLCAFLGITREHLDIPADFVRVLAMNDRGREILNIHKKDGFFRNPGEKICGIQAELESRCGALYGLFSVNETDPPDMESRRRLLYIKN